MQPLQVTDLTTLDPAQVAQARDLLVALVQAADPTIDAGRGVLGQLVLGLEASLRTAERVNYTALLQSMSLLQITANPALATPGIVDAVLSNFRVTRLPGAAATGQVTIVLDALIPVTIPAGASFTANGVTFTTTAAYAARTDQALVTAANDRVLVPSGSGQYAFTIPLVAATPGVAGMIRNGTLLVPGFAITHLVTAYAAGDFSGGLDNETNAQLLARFQAGIAAPAWSNRSTSDAMLRAQPQFAAILQTSTIGMGDPELLRDQHGLFPIAGGGRCDLYCRTALLPVATVLTRTATYLGAAASGGGVWQFSLGRDDAPGFYTIDQVAPVTATFPASGGTLLADIRGFDLSGLGWTPDIVTATEAAYTRYQTSTVRFVDPTPPAASLTPNVSTQDYTVTVSRLPQLDAVQDFLSDRGRRPPAGDVLVRAPIPCTVAVSFTVRKRSNLVPDPDIAAIQAAVAAAVNTLGFSGELYASLIAATVHPLLPPGAELSAIEMTGTIRQADGSTIVLRDIGLAAVLTVPTTAVMTSPRTVCFYCAAASVAVAVTTLALPEL